MEGAREIYTDESKMEGHKGMVGGGWFESNGVDSRLYHSGTNDGEVAGMRGALEWAGRGRTLLLTENRGGAEGR